MKKINYSLVLIAIIASLCLGININVIAATQYEYEDNNSYAMANILQPGNSVIGSINSTYDDDYYKLTAKNNGKISISFNHVYEDSYDDWDVYIYKYVNGEYIEMSYTNIDLNANEKIDLPYIGAVKNDVYYIRVSRCCSDVVGKKYTIKTTITKSDYYEKEINNVYSTATNMSLNRSYSGTINSNSDNDYYKIVAPSNGKIAISFQHVYMDNYDDWDVYIYRYNNGEYAELSYTNIDLNANEKIHLPYIGAVKNGVYYIKVSRCCSDVVGKNYTIKTTFTKSNYYEKENNNVFSTATNIALNHSYSGNINNTYDDDYYKIIAPAKGKIQIEFKHTYVDSYDDWEVYVYRYSNGEYKELSYTNIDLNSKSTIDLPMVGTSKNAIYYIKVKRCCSGIVGKNYTLKVNFYLPTISKISSKPGKKQVKLSWKKVSGASGYQIQMKKGKKYKAVATTKSKKYTIKKLSSRKKYEFRVRYYKIIKGKKYYSVWKKIKVKTK